MKTPKSVFTCTECGHTTAKWYGKCPACGTWNSMEEGDAPVETAATTQKIKRITPEYESEVVAFDDLELPSFIRSATGMGELDRVLGGGLVHGSVVLLAGEPGIGKSTLLLQISSSLCRGENGTERKVLYISGEESQGQLKLRAKRLGVGGKSLYVLTETNVRRIMAQCDKLHPDVIIVDSVQTMYDEHVASAPGSIAQVRESSLAFIAKAKNEGVSVIMVGHVNKEGGIAGPKVLEHMVDAVLYFEGEKLRSYRIIRAIKNRFGSTNEIGVFEMYDTGLREVENPSEMLISGRPKNTPGVCVACVMEGTRPLLAEIQGLVTSTGFGNPRRITNGFDYNRLAMLIAVLEKRAGYFFANMDTYINVVGGMKLDEPSLDLTIVMALVSSLKDYALRDDVLAFGEVGLAGEIRGVSHCEQRIKEASRLGFNRCIIPESNYKNVSSALKKEIEVIPVRTIRKAFEAIIL